KGGFDAVQIHAAHGYLISQFLSPFYNKRADEYGGPLENRMRLLLRVYDAVRKAVGDAFPVLIKINSEDFVAGGFSADECALVCRELEKRGLNGVELSGGLPASGPKLSPVRTVNPASAEEKSYYEDAAKRIKAQLSVPVILVGGIRYPETAERLLREDACDFVSLSRPLISEPDLIRRWELEDAFRARCITCNACFRPIVTGLGFGCPKFNREGLLHA
ncbi:MAG: tRNA-dihydrouridine synthase, partial [bacterium]|nr:tRNA-dihydrouridine synthase [bacterium]